jgi:4-hydroxybenzoate polyprenyltransferase
MTERFKTMSFAETAKYLIGSMRPKQWVKNCAVFAGLIFSKSFLHLGPVIESLYCFFLFSTVSGAVYILNDIIDKEKDELHPVKCKRPIASGKLDSSKALVFSLVVLVISLTLAALLDIGLFLILFAYFFLVLVYSLKLKNIVILDVIILSMGFVLRTVGGAVVIGVWISPWLILCTTLLALFLALNKRKNELLVLSDKAGQHKKILEHYTPELINSMLSVITSATVMSYSLYTFSAGKSSYMMLTIPFVLYGIFRYQYLVMSKDSGGSPELTLFKDKPLLICILLWIITSMVIVAFFQ